MKKHLTVSALCGLLTVAVAVLASCTLPPYGYQTLKWSFEGETDMTTGKQKTEKSYDNTKSYTTVPNTDVSELSATVLPGDTYIGSINTSLLFHDQSAVYLPSGSSATGEVTLRFRTAAGNASGVSVLIGACKNGSFESISMSLEKSENGCDYYSATLPASAENRYYCFRVKSGSETVYYAASRASASAPECKAGNCFILTPGFETPEWSHGVLWYSVFPDSFYNGDILNDAGAGSYSGAISRAWGTLRTGYDYPAKSTYTGKDYYGGDLAGILSKVGYLKNTLNIGAVYTNPIFESFFNVGYGPVDYLTVSRFYGTNGELASLINALHEENMRFITDGVWLYSSADSKEFNKSGFWPEKGAAQTENSPYADFYYLDKNKQWPDYRTVYTDGVYKINFETEFTQNYIYKTSRSALLYFLNAPYNMDGWRLDVPAYNSASQNGYETEQGFRSAMKAVNPNSILIGETTVLPEERQGKALDSVWNYEDFGEVVYGWFGALRNKPGDEAIGYNTVVKLSASEFLNKISGSVNAQPFCVSLSAYNLLSSHDAARILTNLNGDVTAAATAAALQLTLTGSPCIYYGDELGLTGHSASFGNMGCFDWNERNRNETLFGSYLSLTSLRSDFGKLFSEGGFMPLAADDSSDIIAYGRFDENDAVAVVASRSATEQNVTVPVGRLGVIADGETLYDYETGIGYSVSGGTVTVRVAAGGYAVLVRGTARGGHNGGALSADIGSVPVSGSAVYGGGLLTVTGSGRFDDVNDNFRLFAEKIYGAATVSALLTQGDGAGLTIRESESIYSVFAAVTAENGKLTLNARKTEGGQLETVASADAAGKIYLRLVRNAANLFTAEYSSDGVNYTTLGSVSVAMAEGAYAGAFAAGGDKAVTALFENYTVAEGDLLLCDSFDGTVPSASFAVLPESGSYSVGNGVLTLNAAGGTVRMLSQLSSADGSVTVTLTEADGAAGLIMWQDEKNSVSLIRENGKIVLRSAFNGFVTDEASADAPSGTVYLHLQRAGTYISACVSADGKTWAALGGLVNANFSELFAGMTASGGTAVFDDYSVGNMLSGGNSLAAGKDPTVSSFNYTDSGSYGIVYGDGSWSYTDAGFAQNGTSGYAYCDYTVFQNGTRHLFDSTITLGKGGGSAGISFCKRRREDSAYEAGYLVTVSSDGTVRLLLDGAEIAAAPEKVNPKESVRIRIIADMATGIKIYLNDCADAAITAEITENKLYGALSLVTKDKAAEFRNTNTRSYSNGFESYSQMGYNLDGSILKTRVSDYGLLCGPSGRLFGDFSLSTAFMFSTPADGGCAGILLRANTGEYPENTGIFVAFSKGAVTVSAKGKIIAETKTELSTDAKRLKVSLTAAGDSLTVKIGDETVLTADITAYPDAGACEFVASNCQASLYSFSVTPA